MSPSQQLFSVITINILSFSKLQLNSKIGHICLVFLLIMAKVKKTKCMDPKWSPILELALALAA